MSYDKRLVISINWAWAKRVGKTKFLSSLKHLNADKELSEMYDKVVPPKAKKAEK